MQLLTLGGLDLRSGDGTSMRAAAAQQKRVALLCCIALREPGAYTSRNAILALLWPDSDESRARNALRNTLHHLRNQVGANAFITRGDEEIAINPEVLWCDAVAFEQAYAAGRYEEALSLYRGPLLPGFLIGDAPDFNDWVDSRRRTFAAHAADAAKHLAEQYSEEDPKAAVQWAERWVELAPFEERAIRSLMHILAQTGNKAKAISAYDAWHSRLHRELNTNASAETQRVADALRKKTLFTRSHSQSQSPSRSRSRSRSLYAGLAAAVLIVIAGVAAIAVRNRPVTADAGVAVMPFSYGGSAQYGYLREGMVDLIATRLSNGGVRAADPRSIVARADRGSRASLDPARGSALARDVGARYYVLGSVLELNGTVRMSASLYDVENSRPLANTTLSGSVEQVFQLADQITAALVKDASLRARTAPREAETGTTNLAAMRAFVEGQTAYNAARFEEALAAYGRATTADPEFARAYLRLSMAAHWLGNNYDIEYGLKQAHAKAARLSADERLLLHAWQAHTESLPREADSLYSAYLTRHPEDADAWLQLGEVNYHWGATMGRSPASARDAFVQATKLVAHEAPALTHLIRIEGREDNAAAVDRYVAQLLKQKPRAQEEFEARIIRALTRRDTAAARAIAAASPPAEVAGRLSISNVIAVSIPNPAAIRHVVNALRIDPNDPWQVAERATILAQAAAAAGDFAAADKHLDELARVQPARAHELRTFYAALPFRDVTREKLIALRDGLQRFAPADSFRTPQTILRPDRLFAHGLLSLRLGENAEALRTARELEALSTHRNPEISRVGPRWAIVLRAQEALNRRDYGHAREALQKWRIQSHDGYPTLEKWGTALFRYQQADVVFQVKSYRQALQALEAIPDHTGHDIALVSWAHARRAEALRALQDEKGAARHEALVREIE